MRYNIIKSSSLGCCFSLEINCDPNPVVGNATLTSSVGNPSVPDQNTVVTYTCDGGYRYTDLDTVKTFTCDVSGWSPAIQDCTGMSSSSSSSGYSLRQ